jgi:hypothetical protein
MGDGQRTAVRRSGSPAPGKSDITFAVDGKVQKAGGAWYRGEHCNYNPLRENLATAGMIVDNVLKGWTPPTPLIGPRTRVTAFGSCFAQHICEWLTARKFNILNQDAKSAAHIVRMGEGMVNTFSLLEQFRWALEGEHFEGDYWHGHGAASFEDTEEVRLETRRILMSTEVFIITLGLSEIWYDKKTGGVFWRAVPSRLFDPARHGFRVAGFQENKDNIRGMYELIRRHRPDAKVIFTVSPIPLVATFRPVSCVTANSASKALLRGAVDEVIREVGAEGAMFYWPSYEIVLDVFDNQWIADRRHVRSAVLDFVMSLFEQTWCHGQDRRPPLAEAFAKAMLATGAIPKPASKRLVEIIQGRDEDGLAELIEVVASRAGGELTLPCIRDLLREWRTPQEGPVG